MALAAFGTDAYHRIARAGRLRAARRRQLHAHRQRDGDGLSTTTACSTFCPKRERGADVHPGPLRPGVGLPGVRRGDPRALGHEAPGAHRPRTASPWPAASPSTASPTPRSSAQTGFDELYIMPNAGDRGLAAGCRALRLPGAARRRSERHPLTHDYLGRPNTDDGHRRRPRQLPKASSTTAATTSRRSARRSSPTAPSSAGCRAAPSSAPAPSATAASSPTPAPSRPRSGSTPR